MLAADLQIHIKCYFFFTFLIIPKFSLSIQNCLILVFKKAIRFLK